MAYLKRWAPRARDDLALRVPDVLPRAAAGKGHASRLDALEAAKRLAGDVAYLDPPYNQHSFLGNYHVWESLVLWDKPEVYGVACKRVDVRDRGSPFNRRRQCFEALRAVVERVRARVLIVSSSDEGYVSREEMESLLSTRGRVTVHARDYPRYVGAKIGIHGPSGAKVGTVSHLRNTEFLFVVDAAGSAPVPACHDGSTVDPLTRADRPRRPPPP
jgi:adenine-specific DNA-methyltransferase